MTARAYNSSLPMLNCDLNAGRYSTDHGESLKKLFSMQEQLYAAGARNFLLIDVPPMWRIPGGMHFIFLIQYVPMLLQLEAVEIYLRLR